MHFGLDLNLELDKLDVKAMVESTRKAAAADLTASELFKKESTYDAALSSLSEKMDQQPPVVTKATTASASAAESPPTSAEHRQQRQQQQHHQAVASPRSFPKAAPDSTAYRGITGAAEVQRANTKQAVRQQRQQEGAAPYTLKDNLQGLCNTGNWVRAHSLFEDAVQKMCQHIVSTTAADVEADQETASSTSSSSVHGTGVQDDEEARRKRLEAVCFEVLRRQYAVLPPAPSSPGSAGINSSVAAARTHFLRNGAGIMRWQGLHYYLLLKCLLEAGRLHEAERVWRVMSDTGFIEYQMNERTVNSLMSLLRRAGGSEQLSERLIESVVPESSTSASFFSSEHDFQRAAFADLERIAKQKQFFLGSSNKRVSQSLRVASALHNAEQNDATDSSQTSDLDTVAERALSHDTHHSASSGNPSSVSAGDFNGLLRESASHAQTLRLLAAIDKLGFSRNGTMYAQIIASLHNPAYVVEGCDAADVPTSTSPESATTSDAQKDKTTQRAHFTEEEQEKYEAYKDKRITAAVKWFDECPEDMRNADLYNELLYLLRAKRHTEVFDHVLTLFRGNAVRDEAGREKAAVDENHQQRDNVPFILSPKWKVPPTSKTYELLIARCVYLNDWQAMWELYYEMRQSNIRGTRRLYQQLLTHAKRHPPQHLVRDGKDPEQLILEIYSEMKQKRMDVSSITSTANVINAWSTNRARHRWN